MSSGHTENEMYYDVIAGDSWLAPWLDPDSNWEDLVDSLAEDFYSQLEDTGVIGHSPTSAPREAVREAMRQAKAWYAEDKRS